MKKITILFLISLILVLLAGSSLAFADSFPYVTDTSDVIQQKVAQVPIPWQFWAFDPTTGQVIDRIRISPTWLNPPESLPAGTGNIFVRRQFATTTIAVPLEDLVWGDGPVPSRTDLQWTILETDWVEVELGQDLEVSIAPPIEDGAVLVAYEVKAEEGGGGGGGGATARFINEAKVATLPGIPQNIIQILVNFDVHNGTGRNDITNFELDFANLVIQPADVVAAIGFLKAHGIPPVPFPAPIPWGANANSYLVVRPINNGTGTEVKWLQTDHPSVDCDWLHVGLVFNYSGDWDNNLNSTVQGYWTTTNPPPPPVPELPTVALLALGLALIGALIVFRRRAAGAR